MGASKYLLQRKYITYSKIRSLYFYTSVILSLTFYQNLVYTQDLSLGVKSGIVFNRVGSLNSEYSMYLNEGYLEYSYAPGFYITFSSEMNTTNNTSILCELSFLQTISKVTLFSTTGGIIENRLLSNYLKLPILFKYQTNWFISPYLLSGIEFGYLLDAEYKKSDLFYKYSREKNLSDDLSTLNLSVIIGVGKKMIFLNQSFLIEIRAALGLTKYTTSDDSFVGSWRNNNLLIGLGMVF